MVINKLVAQAKDYIIHYGGQTTLDFILGDDQKYFEFIDENIQQVQLIDLEIILGKLFNEIGVDIIGTIFIVIYMSYIAHK